MRRKMLMMCLVLVVSAVSVVHGVILSGNPGYVYNGVNASGWIDAGSSPDFTTYTYSYDTIDQRWWLNFPLGGGNAVYRFEAPAGKFIDATQFGVYGWTLDSGHKVTVSYNGAPYDTASGADYRKDFSRQLIAPVKRLDIMVSGSNGWDPDNPDLTRVYGTWQATGNDYAMAAHVIDAKTDYTIYADESDSFSVVGPAEAFTDWAVYNFGATGSMKTVYQNGNYFTGGDNNDGWGRNFSMDIPFSFDKALESGLLEYSSTVHSYGSNYGWVQLDVVTDEGTTMIYRHSSPDFAEPVNYNHDGAAPTGGGYFATSTVIDDLIAGETEFTLRMSGYVGWSNYWYNGGQFLPSNLGQDFVFSGTVVPEPVTMSLLALGGLGIMRRKES